MLTIFNRNVACQQKRTSGFIILVTGIWYWQFNNYNAFSKNDHSAC